MVANDIDAQLYREDIHIWILHKCLNISQFHTDYLYRNFVEFHKTRQYSQANIHRLIFAPNQCTCLRCGTRSSYNRPLQFHRIRQWISLDTDKHSLYCWFAHIVLGSYMAMKHINWVDVHNAILTKIKIIWTRFLLQNYLSEITNKIFIANATVKVNIRRDSFAYTMRSTYMRIRSACVTWHWNAIRYWRWSSAWCVIWRTFQTSIRIIIWLVLAGSAFATKRHQTIL